MRDLTKHFRVHPCAILLRYAPTVMLAAVAVVVATAARRRSPRSYSGASA
ncbi:hypothetical protein GA0070604_3451 [Micromonospora eburnea]|uniref:Uncharacterized protein n=1 Tax=Micromonospora eburnea TaxID=227316 RepID=A0A1C6URN9_9ACTN|nr:hypothetical protein GA0070604_3451 [Micromonospora eburnea]